MKWVELSVESHPEAVDAIANVFQQFGSGGVAIEQPITAHIEGETPPEFVGMPVIKTYLPLNERAAESERAVEEALWHLQAFDLSPVGPLRRREVEEDDWANGWKEHFHPLKIGRIVVKPSWREWDPGPEEVVVELDPGMAFGTGLHPTTRLMIEALQTRIMPGTRVLDLGTGSGILAIAAGLLGAEVEALDISDVAVEVAAQNIRVNELTHRVAVADGSLADATAEGFELILANIIASVLIDLAPELYAKLASGGTLLASGIIAERLDAVRDAFLAAGLEIEQELNDGDWYLIAARRR